MRAPSTCGFLLLGCFSSSHVSAVSRILSSSLVFTGHVSVADKATFHAWNVLEWNFGVERQMMVVFCNKYLCPNCCNEQIALSHLRPFGSLSSDHLCFPGFSILWGRLCKWIAWEFVVWNLENAKEYRKKLKILFFCFVRECLLACSPISVTDGVESCVYWTNQVSLQYFLSINV